MKEIPHRPSVVIDAKIPFIKGVLEPYANVRYIEGSEITSSVVSDADALIIRTRTHCNEQLLQHSSVKFIATATIGTDHIDTAYCDSHDIVWTNAAGCNAGSVYQYVASVLAWLVQNRNLDLSSLTLGVVGCGHVGSKIVRLGQIFGMKVLVNDPPLQRTQDGNFVSLDHLLACSDIVTLHTPLNRDGEDKTYHLIDKEQLGRMKSTAWLINSSRGEVVDGTALEETLDNGRLGGAVLDVWENEPEISLSLLKKVNLSTPHIAGYSVDGKATATMMSIQSLSNFFSLPLCDWHPASIPLPLHTLQMTIDAFEKSLSQVLSEAIAYTYAVAEDDRRLRESVADFERQRGNYPVRREFYAYEVNLVNGNQQMAECLAALGFQVVIP